MRSSYLCDCDWLNECVVGSVDDTVGRYNVTGITTDVVIGML
jgi:hypothetical protein